MLNPGSPTLDEVIENVVEEVLRERKEEVEEVLREREEEGLFTCSRGAGINNIYKPKFLLLP